VHATDGGVAGAQDGRAYAPAPEGALAEARAGRRAAELALALEQERLQEERASRAELARQLELVHISRAWRLVQRMRRLEVAVHAGWRRATSLPRAVLSLPFRLRKNFGSLGHRLWLDMLPLGGTRPGAPAAGPVWRGPTVVGGRSRTALLVPPGVPARFDFDVPPRARLYAALAVDPESWARSTRAVSFTVEVTAPGRGSRSRTWRLDPLRRLGHRGWREAHLDLRALAGARATLALTTSGPEGAQPLWGDAVVVSPPTLRGAARKLWLRFRQAGTGHLVRRALGATPPRVFIGEYAEWIRENEPGPEALARQAEEAATLAYRPLVSVVLPVYEVARPLLEEALDSVQAQTYPFWELCVADASPAESGLGALLAERARADPRIRVHRLDSNLGISANSNQALALARGEYVLFLDHDDVLAPFALFALAGVLNGDPSLDLLYSDRDMLDASGLRCHPLFKPGWSPSTLLSANYLAHAALARRQLVADVGGFRPAFDGAQDWDLFLRLAERTGRIAHVPGVLYHWRVAPTSCAGGLEAKPYAAAAQVRAVEDHLRRAGRPATVERRPDSGFLHVRWEVPAPPRVTVVVPTRDKAALLRRCLSGLRERTSYANLEILLVENGSRERETLRLYAELGQARGVRILDWEKPFNYSAVNNWAARQAEGELLLFLNNDTEVVDPDWLREMVSWAQQPGVGAVGAKLMRPEGTVQHGGVVLGLGGFAGHLFAGAGPHGLGLFGSVDWYRDLLAVTGACLLVPRALFLELGGFDEAFSLCGSDVDLCLRIRRAGRRVVYTPFATLVHHEAATRGEEVPEEDYEVSRDRYRPYLTDGDPFFNPNLSLWSTQPRLRRRGEAGARGPEHARGPTAPPAPATGAPPRDRYSREAEVLAHTFDCDARLLAENRRLAAECPALDVRSVTWLLPEFQYAYYGGVYTILRFAADMLRNRGVATRLVVVSGRPVPSVRARILEAFPELEAAEVVSPGWSDLSDLPASDAVVATFWSTAYALLRHRRAKRKFYFLQDLESLFYPAGAISGLVEATYGFGFFGIANSEGVRAAYERDFGGSAMAFDPCVDPELFHARRPERKGPRTLFCYGRPAHPRNAFELAAAALRAVKDRLGSAVRIVSAGDEWRPADYGLAEVVHNRGRLGLEEAAALYREADVGLVLMLTRHPSYIPLELMASGCLVVTNDNPATRWFFEHGVNCLTAPASASALAQAIVGALGDEGARRAITTAAAERVRRRHSDWPAQAEKVYRFLCDPRGGRS
jgi:GT2 family glycosyltransferase/glycosyltransferase involved in cell wall biosynthesis